MSLSRGRFPGRLSLPDLDPATLAHYRLHWSGEALYNHPEQFPALTAKQLFGVDAPLALDVGCATGEFVCGLAAQHPERCFLGVEMSRKPIEHAVARALALGADNIRFLQADMTLVAPLLVPASLSAVYIHFPVPFTTTHKRKHYTYSPAMLAHYQRAFVPGGRLSIVTDEPRVVEDTQRMLADAADFRQVAEADWQLALDDHLKSPYQRLWEKRKRAIWRAEYESHSAR